MQQVVARSPRYQFQLLWISISKVMSIDIHDIVETYAQHCPAATATALPPELPPAENAFPSMSVFCTGPKAALTECDPIPNSSMFVLPMSCAPLFRSNRTTVASYGLLWFRRRADAQVVGKSTVHMLSLIAISRPLKG
jgi:hypothetical protein